MTRRTAASPSRPAAPRVVLHAQALHRDVASDPTLPLLSAPNGPAAAALRVLRHRCMDADQHRALVVSSPGDDEGKTTLAINLALALAEHARARVLLVEGHLARPALETRLRLDVPVCLAAQLDAVGAGKLSTWSLVDLVGARLHVAAVSASHAPRPLRDGPSVTRGLRQLVDAGYDHVVIDGPPVVGGADVHALHDAADAVLLAARRGVTTARALRAALAQLEPRGALGTVLVG